MEISVGLVEKDGVNKSELREAGSNYFVYTVAPGSFNPKEKFHIEDLVGELNYLLKRKGLSELDAFVVRRDLERLYPGGKVYLKVEEPEQK